MNIAIVAPSPVPFVMGGAENLWLGLQRYINEETTHHCELFKIPTRESNLLEIVNSYRSHGRLELNSYDRVISTKYPAWMIQHHSHAVYLQHTLRGLYDTYHFCKEPIEFEYSGKTLKLRKIMDALLVDSNTSNVALEPFFEIFEKSLINGDIDTQTARFPGPFARDIIHFLDSFALKPNRIASYTAISRTVRDRADYFPKGVEVGVVYHPPRLDGYFCQGDEFLFTSSRLDGPKRVGLLVEAMRYVQSDIKLMIGGKGPDEERLKKLAADDQRIVFLGYLTDSQMLDYYANALAVPFVPYDEDYGLITIEAMRSGKPVITTSDSGGVTEFVINGETGMVVPPDPNELARAIDYLCTHRSEAKAMGRNAKKVVSDITWRKVAERLIGIELQGTLRTKQAICRASSPVRKKLVVAVTFPIYPPRGGGQSRIYNLYREWARHYDITIVTLTNASDPAFVGEIAPNLTEVRIPKSVEHQSAEDDYSRTVEWVPVTDIVAARVLSLTPEYTKELKKACAEADIVVASHPYLVGPLREYAPHASLWFEAHNVEYTLKQNILPSSDASNSLLEMVREDEIMSWREAELVFACAQKDLEVLEEMYGSTNAIILEVPNGFAIDEVRFTTTTIREKVKESIGLHGQDTVIFMGSWHGPNLEVVERIFDYAIALPSVTFLVVGSAGLKFLANCRLPNIKLLGVVDEKEKQVLLSAADLAINPMTSGSGSNLKMLDYFAAGVPVMSTSFGARGIDAQPETHYFLAEIDDFMFHLTQFFVQKDSVTTARICQNAAELVNTHYSWTTIAERAHRTINASVYR